MTTAELKPALPEQLAREAGGVGPLMPKVLRYRLRDEVRHPVDRLFDATDRPTALP